MLVSFTETEHAWSKFFSNLISNAVRYTPDGRKTHIVFEVDDAAAVVNVIDNGLGIGKSLIASLFDMYVQAERSSDRLGGGLGLGLPLVKSLVAVHSGSVTAHSRGASLGSTFAVKLPRIFKVFLTERLLANAFMSNAIYFVGDSHQVLCGRNLCKWRKTELMRVIHSGHNHV